MSILQFCLRHFSHSFFILGIKSLSSTETARRGMNLCLARHADLLS